MSEAPQIEIFKEELFYSKMSEERAQPIFEEEQLPAAMIHIADKDSQAAGDDSTQIMQQKPEAAGECPTENDKKPLSECILCGKITDDHDFFNCPDRERIRKLTSYCMVCNKKTDHDTPDCPKATEDVLKNLAYCSICDKNTDHDTFDCPNENGFVWIDGVKIPNVCDLCRVVGHRGIDCPIDSDHDLEYGLDSSMDDW